MPMDAADLLDESRVEVHLGDRSYGIELTTGTDPQTAATELVAAMHQAVGDCTHVIVISDSAVETTLAAPILVALDSANLRVTSLVVPSGESSKSMAQFESLSAAMLAAAADRRSVVVAVGGGVVGDLAGFIAATFTRGLRLVQVPTTLLAMVDSSVGGKTGINLPGGKNLVGSFWQPHLVWVDSANLDTLPDREYRSGLAEVIKYGIIEDADFAAWLVRHAAALVDRDALAVRHAVAQSCRCKARVVADDERETTGRRAILNYGHTFAHAIESTAGYGYFLHGEAVAIGMQMAARLAEKQHLCGPEVLELQTEFLTAVNLPMTWGDAEPAKMLPVMARDKKVAHGQLRFVLPTRIGHVDLVSDVAAGDVQQAILDSRV